MTLTIYLKRFYLTGPVKSEYFNVTFSSDNNLNGRGFFATYTIHTGVSDGLRQPVQNYGEGRYLQLHLSIHAELDCVVSGPSDEWEI